VLVVDRGQFPENIDPQPGQQLQMVQGDQVVVVTVASVSDDGVVLDANHPLAGENLNFELHLQEIV
ncbi:MAG: peptidylprolyl isomerase, partial [Gemmatimonadetes bacterium]|nr:peptidylprolyl isomerase [Gemmatimonadota bacterium]